MMAVLNYLRSTAYVGKEEDLRHIPLLLREHITFHRSYHFDLGEPSRRTELRPPKSHLSSGGMNQKAQNEGAEVPYEAFR